MNFALGFVAGLLVAALVGAILAPKPAPELPLPDRPLSDECAWAANTARATIAAADCEEALLAHNWCGR